MLKTTFSLFVAGLLSVSLQAQVCDPSVAPTGLTSAYIPGTGALLEWNAVPGSVGVQLRVDLPSGSTINRRIIGSERDQFAVPDALLTPGTYTWRVQAACSTIPPYSVTPISSSATFEKDFPNCGTVTDIDGNVYSTVQIGSQCWTDENVKMEHYRSGDAIPSGLSDASWQTTSSGASTIYDNNPTNKVTYGLLYNGFAAIDVRGLCPTGWHVPTDAEWMQLVDFLGGFAVAGGKMKTTGTSGAGTGLWSAPNVAASNSSGFSGLPGGNRAPSGLFGVQGNQGYWWSSSVGATQAFNRECTFGGGDLINGSNDQHYGFSVRCLKD